jgi:hypothetical protein
LEKLTNEVVFKNKVIEKNQIEIEKSISVKRFEKYLEA